MIKLNKTAANNHKMTTLNIEINKLSYQQMCEDLYKYSKLLTSEQKNEFLKKVQDAQSSATTTV